jgi:hypothetical protein
MFVIRDTLFKGTKKCSSVLNTGAACSSQTVVWQDYIHKVPVSLHYNLQHESHKPYCPPTSVTWLQLLCKQTNTGHLNTLIYTHMTSRTLPTCDISLGSLMLTAPEAGDLVELLLLYLPITLNNVIIQNPTKHEHHYFNHTESSILHSQVPYYIHKTFVPGLLRTESKENLHTQFLQDQLYYYRADSTVIITTRRPSNRSSIPNSGETVCSPQYPYRLWGPPSFLANGYFPGRKTTGSWSWTLIYYFYCTYSP